MFRRLPLILDARQYLGDAAMPGVCICCGRGKPHLHTLEGSVRLRDGDWIVIGSGGDRQCVADSVFQKTYEAVETAPKRV